MMMALCSRSVSTSSVKTGTLSGHLRHLRQAPTSQGPGCRHYSHCTILHFTLDSCIHSSLLHLLKLTAFHLCLLYFTLNICILLKFTAFHSRLLHSTLVYTIYSSLLNFTVVFCISLLFTAFTLKY